MKEHECTGSHTNLLYLPEEVDWHAQYDAATMVAAEWEAKYHDLLRNRNQIIEELEAKLQTEKQFAVMLMKRLLGEQADE